MQEHLGLLEGLTEGQIAFVRLRCELNQHYFTRVMFRAMEGHTFRVGQHHKLIDKTLDEVVQGKRTRVLINEPPGYSKAIDCDTPMWTPKGWVSAGEIRPGDRLMGSNGKWTRVTHIYPQGVKPAFDVKFSDGSALVTCADHQWTVRLRDTLRDGRPAKWQVKTTDQLIGDLLGPDGRKRWRIPVVVDTNDADVELPIDPYLLGCWLGDGDSVHGAFTSMDPEIVEAFAPYDPHPKKHQNSGRAISYQLIGFRTRLRKLGLIGNKHIPAIYMLASKAQRLALLQGLCDTDGWVAAANGQQGFAFSHDRLSADARSLVNSLGGVWTGFSGMAGKKMHHKTFLSMPLGMTAFRLPRKVERVNPRQTVNTPRRFIASITPTTPREMVCFTVDAADSLFCAGREFIVTHNTLQSVIMFVARGFALNPRARFLHGSYSRELVNLNSSQIIDVMSLPEYRKMWGRTLRPDSSAKSLWRTPEGGAFKASSAGGSVTGFRAGNMDQLGGDTSDRAEFTEAEIQAAIDELEHDLDKYTTGDMSEGFSGALIIDDPLKPDDASSDVKRKFINARYMNTFRSRLAHELVPIVVTMQRIHPDDFSNHLLTGGGGEPFDHLLLPIEVKKQPYPTAYTSGRLIEHQLPDGPLWRAKHNQAQIDVLKHDSKVFSAQYAQNPKLSLNQTFTPSYFRSFEVRPRTLNVGIIVDPSKGKTKRSDRTAMAVIGIDANANKYLLDGFCHRMNLSQRWTHLKRLYQRWATAPGIMQVTVGYEQYGMQSDLEHIQERQEIDGPKFAIQEVNWVREGSQSKEDRIQRLEPDFKGTRFFMPVTIYRPENGGDCFWTGADHGVEFRKAWGKTSSQIEVAKRGESFRVIESIKRVDENGQIYDLTWELMQELTDFPNALHDDFSDAVSLVYDLGMIPAPKKEVETVAALNASLVA